MTQEEINDYNRRCAEFLGWNKWKTDNTAFVLPENFDVELQRVYEAIYVECLKFHSDWNWIMEVVEAIEKLFEHPNKEINVDIKAGQIEIFQRPYRLENNDYHEIIYLGDGYINGSKKEAVVQAINQFLMPPWWNG